MAFVPGSHTIQEYGPTTPTLTRPEEQETLSPKTSAPSTPNIADNFDSPYFPEMTDKD